MIWCQQVLGLGHDPTLSDITILLQSQHHILKKMKAGELDIVISTAVAEEGLDVKQCQLVIRFDLPSTLLAFVQSRCAPTAPLSPSLLLHPTLQHTLLAPCTHTRSTSVL